MWISRLLFIILSISNSPFNLIKNNALFGLFRATLRRPCASFFVSIFSYHEFNILQFALRECRKRETQKWETEAGEGERSAFRTIRRFIKRRQENVMRCFRSFLQRPLPSDGVRATKPEIGEREERRVPNAGQICRDNNAASKSNGGM